MISGHSPRWLLIAGIALIFASLAALLIPRSTNPGSLASVGDDLCIVAPATPYDPASGQQMLDPRPVPAEARCPVCGMYPARFPHWAAQAIFADGAVHFFDSPVNLYVFLDRVERYSLAYTKADVRAMFVTDVTTGAWIEAGTAWFVLGSDALGPMRDGNLPAFASASAAQEFATRRGGKVLAANEITLDLLKPLIPSAHHHHTAN
ncbi:MAG: nitrous oxide reductase accessory protein NosL [Rhodocyclaceae bacterium]|jgi:nitrous oxide reductase accessory protein NosL|nr:nitrous oxide reductase accessory protein NosL [Rhodocyclaceae bacterium]